MEERDSRRGKPTVNNEGLRWMRTRGICAWWLFCFGFACKLQAETLGNSGGSLINKRVGKPDMDRDTRHSSLGRILV
jgi:hypothetical protein